MPNYALKYDGERYIPGQTSDNVREDHERRYRHIRRLLKRQRVLDVACGSGFGIKILSSFCSSIIGVDRSFDAIRFAGQNFMQSISRLAQADAVRLPFADNTFDAVVSFETIEHLPEPEKFLREVRRVLIPSGRLYISTPVKKGDSLDKFHFREYEIDEFVNLVSRFFLIEKVEGQRFMFSPLFALFSWEWVNSLKKISLVKELYRKCYGKDKIKPVSNSNWFIPNFLIVSCKNEK